MKSAILVTARLKSTRLPRKALREVGGRSLLAHLLDRLKLAERPDEIVICTSTVAEDDPLEELADAEGVACFRGDPDDVLARITAAAVAHDLDVAVSCTADNPFVDAPSIDALIDYHVAQELHFTRIDGLPWGSFSYALDRRAMERAIELTGTRDTEVWGGYFTQTGLFDCGVLEIDDPDLRWPELRLTVDVPEDFALVERIFDELGATENTFPLQDVVRLCRAKPDIAKINAHVTQAAAKPIVVK